MLQEVHDPQSDNASTTACDSPAIRRSSSGDAVRVFVGLLAQTEQRLVATLERHGEDLTAVRGELAAVLAMLDRSQFTYLCYTPEVPPAGRDRAYASGQQRFAVWREAVARLLKAAGRPVPWPLTDPEGTASQASGGPQGTASRSPEAGQRPRPGRV